VLEFKIVWEFCLFVLNGTAMLDKVRYYSKATLHQSLIRHTKVARLFLWQCSSGNKAPEILSCHESSAWHYEKSEKQMNQSSEA